MCRQLSQQCGRNSRLTSRLSGHLSLPSLGDRDCCWHFPKRSLTAIVPASLLLTSCNRSFVGKFPICPKSHVNIMNAKTLGGRSTTKLPGYRSFHMKLPHESLGKKHATMKLLRPKLLAVYLGREPKPYGPIDLGMYYGMMICAVTKS